MKRLEISKKHITLLLFSATWNHLESKLIFLQQWVELFSISFFFCLCCHVLETSAQAKWRRQTYESEKHLPEASNKIESWNDETTMRRNNEDLNNHRVKLEKRNMYFQLPVDFFLFLSSRILWKFSWYLRFLTSLRSCDKYVHVRLSMFDYNATSHYSMSLC